jgi:hypothetical protein
MHADIYVGTLSWSNTIDAATPRADNNVGAQTAQTLLSALNRAPRSAV